jgi:hypothetical protein
VQFAAGGRRGPDGVARVGGDARRVKQQLEHNTESSRVARTRKATTAPKRRPRGQLEAIRGCKVSGAVGLTEQIQPTEHDPV